MAAIGNASLIAYLKAAFPDDVAPLIARVSKLAKILDVTEKDVRELIRTSGIQPLQVASSGARYCVPEVWEAVCKTRGQYKPTKGGRTRGI